jgi:hypothetical protein
MLSSLFPLFAFLLLPFVVFGQIEDNDGYTGYKLDIRQDGDPTAMVYETANTQNNVSALVPEPDVFLNVCLLAPKLEDSY